METQPPGEGRCRLHRSQFPQTARTRAVALSKLMASKYRQFDRGRLSVLPLGERTHDLQLSRWIALDEETPPFAHSDLSRVAERLHAAKDAGAARVLIMGAHLLRAGVNRH